ncbi:MAG: hypothetical protein GXN98_02245 [Euryarchaeota archaeon]|nr:hypothetical protein [Euryarchaeota archaeon]
MPRRRQVRGSKGKLTAVQLGALFGIGIMVLSSLAYAILYNPFGGGGTKKPAAEGQVVVSQDSDLDGIPDYLEKEIGTDPYSPDTVRSLEERKQQVEKEYAQGLIGEEEYRSLIRKIEAAEEVVR